MRALLIILTALLACSDPDAESMLIVECGEQRFEDVDWMHLNGPTLQFTTPDGVKHYVAAAGCKRYRVPR